MMNWSWKACRWVNVRVATRLATRLPMVGPKRPESHGRAATHLWGEVADERRSGDQDDAFDEPDDAVRHDERELGVHVGDGHQLEQAHDECAEDGEVGPADLVGQSPDEGGESSDGIETTSRYEEVPERHVVVRAASAA